MAAAVMATVAVFAHASMDLAAAHSNATVVSDDPNGFRCHFDWHVSDAACTRLTATRVYLSSTFAQCYGGARANFRGEGVTKFPPGFSLSAGNYQWRAYELGVAKKVAEGAGDLFKNNALVISGNRWALDVPFTMPIQQKTGDYTVEFLARDQNKTYDLCLELHFNYTS